VRVVGSPKKDFFDVVTDRDERLFVGRDRIVFTKPPKPKTPSKPKPPNPKPPVQPELPFGKDMFLHRNRQRISPDAERGYKTLTSMRRNDLSQAAGSASLAGVGGWLTHHEWKAKPRTKPALAAAALGTAGATISTVGQLKSAHRLETKREKIRAKARSRKAQGLYAPGRGLEPVDTTSRRARST
jgi:hypothetical protein